VVAVALPLARVTGGAVALAGVVEERKTCELRARELRQGNLHKIRIAEVVAAVHVGAAIGLDDQVHLRRLAIAAPKVQATLDGKQVVKAIVVPGKLVNIVVR